jgi:hypothetical protein
LPGRSEQFLQYAPVAQQVTVYFPDNSIVSAFQLIVIAVPAKIITEFFIRTAMDAAVAAKTGFYFCDHGIVLMAVTDGTQNTFPVKNIDAY